MNTSLLPLSLSRANGKYVMTLRQTGTPLLPSRLNRFAPPTISESDDGICSCLPESQSRRGGGGGLITSTKPSIHPTHVNGYLEP